MEFFNVSPYIFDNFHNIDMPIHRVYGFYKIKVLVITALKKSWL